MSVWRLGLRPNSILDFCHLLLLAAFVLYRLQVWRQRLVVQEKLQLGQPMPLLSALSHVNAFRRLVLFYAPALH